MNAQAQNSMLKTLEEPAGRTLIILLTDQANALLPTIRSRCQMVRFALMDEPRVRQELARRGIDAAVAADAAVLSRGSLGVALKWIEDGVVAPARELTAMLDRHFRQAAVDDLPGWFKNAADALRGQAARAGRAIQQGSGDARRADALSVACWRTHIRRRAGGSRRKRRSGIGPAPRSTAVGARRDVSGRKRQHFALFQQLAMKLPAG